MINTLSTPSTSQLKAEIIPIPSNLVESNSLPIHIRQSSSKINNVQTNVLVQEFFDQTLVIVSQLGKIGCLTKITIQNRPDYQFLSLNAAGGDIENDLPPPLDQQKRPQDEVLVGNCSQQRLFGTHPPGKKALYDLYNIHIAIQTQKALSSRSSRPDIDSSFNEKPIIVGLALQQQHQSTNSSSTINTNEDEDDDDFDLLANDERERFQGILDLVKKACT